MVTIKIKDLRTITKVEDAFVLPEKAVKSSLNAYYAAHVKKVVDKERDTFVESNQWHVNFCFSLFCYAMIDRGLEAELSELTSTSTDVMHLIEEALTRANDLTTSFAETQDSFIEVPETFTAGRDLGDHLNNLYAGYRMLARVALDHAPWLESAAISKYLAASKYNRLWRNTPDSLSPSDTEYKTSWFCQEILPILRQEMSRVFGGLDLKDDFDPYIHSSGAVQDACNNPFCKWLTVEYGDRPVPIKGIENGYQLGYLEDWQRSLNKLYRELQATASSQDAAALQECIYGPDDVLPVEYFYDGPTTKSTYFCVDGQVKKEIVYRDVQPVYTVSPNVVPKTLKSGRMVCIEKAWYLNRQHNYAKQIQYFWSESGRNPRPELCYKNQEESRSLVAQPGYSSVDQSSASDAIRRTFLKDVFPSMVQLRKMLKYMPTHIIIGGRILPMIPFGTMGSPLTFPMLGGVSLALANTAKRWANILDGYGDVLDRPAVSRGRGKKKEESCNEVRVVGDDIVLPDWAYGCLLAILEQISCFPNMDKSYTAGHPFREACGYEGFYHENADVIYIPRGAVFGPNPSNKAAYDAWRGEYKSTLGAAVSLNNRLYGKFGDESLSARFMRVYLRNIGGSFDVRFDPNCNDGTVWGPDVIYKFDSVCGDPLNVHAQPKSRLSRIPISTMSERLNVSYLTVEYDPYDGNPSCICKALPRGLLNRLSAEFEVNTFLLSGPRYPDNISELLGASQKLNYTGAYGKTAHVVFGKKKA